MVHWYPTFANPKWLALTFAYFLGLVSNVAGAEQPKWQAEWQRVIEAAKKEGQLSLYGGQEITHPEILAAFNKEFPFIKIISASGRAADMMTRIVAERRAEKYLADITASGPNGPRMLYLAKILDPITPAFIFPEVTDASKWYGGKHWYADPENKYLFMFEGTIVSTGLSYNTKLMQADEIKSYWDLLQPKWKGKLLGQDPRSAALATPVLILYHRVGLGAEFLRRFYTETDITLFRDRRQGTNWLATGKFRCVICAERSIKRCSRVCPWMICRRINSKKAAPLAVAVAASSLCLIGRRTRMRRRFS
jgi:hypothetical protein